MPYVFGAGTDTYAKLSYDPAFGSDDHTFLIMGWWRPTTLTAGRTLWAAGPTTRCQIHTTTDELIIYTSHNTTNGQYTTTGVDMVAGDWVFLAFLIMQNTTPGTQYVKVWASRPTGPDPFSQATVTQATAPSGAPASSQDVWICNDSSNATAFQGELAEFFVAADTSTDRSVFPFNASGAISAFDETYILHKYIRPYWRGTQRITTICPQSTSPSLVNVTFDNALAGRRFYITNQTGTEYLLNFRPDLSGQNGQFIRPESFVSSTNWTGAVTAIDETTADDADFVYSANNTAAVLEIAMTNPSAEAGLKPTVRYRHAKTNAGTVDGGGNAVSVTGELFDGASLMVSDSAQSTSGTWTTRTWTPTLSSQPSSNWDDVRVKLTTTASGGSPANRRGCGISWVEIQWVAETAPSAATGSNHPRRPRGSRFRYHLPIHS